MGPGSERTGRPVVVGVCSTQPEQVLREAATLAGALGAELVCAHVVAGRFVVAEDPDGNVTSEPIDPDLDDVRETRMDSALLARLAAVLDPTGVRWSTRALAGDPADSLGHLAQTLDASLIVVGAHRRGLAGGVQELFNRSVAVRLVHRQGRPVVVVPGPHAADSTVGVTG